MWWSNVAIELVKKLEIHVRDKHETEYSWVLSYGWVPIVLVPILWLGVYLGAGCLFYGWVFTHGWVYIHGYGCDWVLILWLNTYGWVWVEIEAGWVPIFWQSEYFLAECLCLSLGGNWSWLSTYFVVKCLSGGRVNIFWLSAYLWLGAYLWLSAYLEWSA